MGREKELGKDHMNKNCLHHHSHIWSPAEPLNKNILMLIKMTMQFVLYLHAVSYPPVKDSQVGHTGKDNSCQIDLMVSPSNRDHF